jgi:hypothetical protein
MFVILSKVGIVSLAESFYTDLRVYVVRLYNKAIKGNRLVQQPSHRRPSHYEHIYTPESSCSRLASLT